MFKRYAVIFLAIILFASSAFADEITGICNQVVDANTLIVTSNGSEYKVKLAYIDAPELGQKFGPEAKQFVESLALNQKLKIVSANTKGNVITAEVYSPKKQDPINRELVRNGLAWPIQLGGEKHPYEVSLSLAKKRQLGIWSDPSLKTPAEYRKTKEEQHIAREKSLIYGKTNDEQRIAREESAIDKEANGRASAKLDDFVKQRERALAATQTRSAGDLWFDGKEPGGGGVAKQAKDTPYDILTDNYGAPEHSQGQAPVKSGANKPFDILTANLDDYFGKEPGGGGVAKQTNNNPNATGGDVWFDGPDLVPATETKDKPTGAGKESPSNTDKKPTEEQSLISRAIPDGLRYEEADFERYRFRYDRVTKNVYCAYIALVTKSGGSNQANLWHKTQYVSLQQAISEEQRKARESGIEEQRQIAKEQRRTSDEQQQAIEDAADEQRWESMQQRQAIEDAADEQRREAMQQRRAMEEQSRAIEEQKRDAEFEKLRR